MSENICHYCEENEAEGKCEQCDQPVCIDCCVVMTLQNQIDYPLCLECEDNNETDREIEAQAEWKWEEERKAKKAIISAARKKAYWKPEAVEKRRLKKIEKQRLQKEANEKRMKETVRIVGDMFRGMF